MFMSILISNFQPFFLLSKTVFTLWKHFCRNEFLGTIGQWMMVAGWLTQIYLILFFLYLYFLLCCTNFFFTLRAQLINRNIPTTKWRYWVNKKGLPLPKEAFKTFYRNKMERKSKNKINLYQHFVIKRIKFISVRINWSRIIKDLMQQGIIASNFSHISHTVPFSMPYM